MEHTGCRQFELTCYLCGGDKPSDGTCRIGLCSSCKKEVAEVNPTDFKQGVPSQCTVEGEL